MSIYCGTPTKVSVRTPKGKIQLRGEQDSLTVRTILTSPNRRTPQLYYCSDEWETLGDTYGLEVDTERREENKEFDFNNGRSFRESVKVKDTDTTLVGGNWGDQFRVAYINGVSPVLIQIKCKDDNVWETKKKSDDDNESNITGKLENKDVYLMYYIEAETGAEKE